MKKLSLYLGILIMLTGCETLQLSEVQMKCDQTTYEASWECIKNQVNANMSDLDLSEKKTKKYLYIGDSLGAQVKTGKLSDNQAKIELMRYISEVEDADEIADKAETASFINNQQMNQRRTCTTTYGITRCN